jgi:hypothetical protein
MSIAKFAVIQIAYGSAATPRNPPEDRLGH